MLKMSFFDGTLNRNKLEEFIRTTNKPIRYTYGLGYRHPTTYKVPVSVEEAIKIIKTEGLLDATEYEDYIHLNAYHENDMW